MNDKLSNKPRPMAWFVFRCLARYFTSLFIPCFRYFGETYLTASGRIFIIKNHGIQTWLFPLCLFKHPLRFVFVEPNIQTLEYFQIAESGGLSPIQLSGNFEEDCILLKQLVEQKENIILVVSAQADDELSNNFTKFLKTEYAPKTLFMAISGAEKVFANNAKTPTVVPVSLFCGMPFLPVNFSNSVFAELNFLEKAIKDLHIEEEPSIFFNHKRNI